MADIEIEEGEARAYQYDEKTNIDLNALTYIDEKLQNVLGHLKKDFEGGVTSENLGAKYGGYGSFLNQLSPVWSSRSLVNVQDTHHISATCLSSEGGSVRSASSDLYKTPSEHDSVIQVARAPLRNSTAKSAAKFEVLHKVNNVNEQKTLKVRIKLGSDNFSTMKNTSICNGLGLVSPSLSFGDSPIGSEGVAQAGDESPTHIIRIMTSIPINGGHLLSPLPEGLARLTDKLLRGNKAQSALRHNRDKYIMESNQKIGKILVEDSLKTEERDHLPQNYEEATEKSRNNVNIIMSNKADLNTEASVVLVSEALKLPLLSDLHGSLIPVISLAGKVADEEKVDSHTDGPSYRKKDGYNNLEAANSSGNTNVNDFNPESRKSSITGFSSSQKQKNGKKYANVQQDVKNLLSEKEELSSGDKKKHKRNQLIGTEATEINQQAVSGNKDNSTVTGTFPKQEDTSKARDMIIANLNCNQFLPPCYNHSRERSDKGAHEQLISIRVFGHVPPTGAPATSGAQVNNSVRCVKCLKWRLLPFGTQVDGLPDNWLCSMLNWLPGMNYCNITQEETSKAVTELYQPPNTTGLLNDAPGVTAPTDMNLSQTRQDIIPGGGKKNHGSKGVPNSQQESLLSVESTELTNTAEYDVKNELHQHLRHSTKPMPETNQHKKKRKKKKHNSCPYGGHSKDIRLGGQREPYQDLPNYKKMKTEDEDLMSTHDVSGNELQTNHASSSQSSKGHFDNSLQDSIEKSEFPHSGLDSQNSNDGTVDTKKRKVKSSVDAASPSILSDDMVPECENMKQKKARMSSLEERAISSSQVENKIENRRKSSKNHQVGKDDSKSLNTESGSGASSGSSKVLDSEKSKFSLLEVKNSPMKSLLLSPFSNRNLDMRALGKKNPLRAGILTKDGSEILADREDYNSGDRCDPMRKSQCRNNDHQAVNNLKNQIDDGLVDYKVEIKHSLDVSSHTLVVSPDKHNVYTFEEPSDHGSLKDPVKSVCNDHIIGSFPKQSASKVSSLSKDTNKIHKQKSDKRKVKICESYDDSQDHLQDKTKDIKMKFQQKSECNPVELGFGGRKKSSGFMLDSAMKGNSKPKYMGQELQEESTFKADSRKHVKTDCSEKVSKSIDVVKNEEVEFLSGEEKLVSKGDLSNHESLPDQSNGADASVRDRDKGFKEHSSAKIPDIQSGAHSSTSKHQLSNVHRIKDQDTLSPMRRDSRNQAVSNALKEAKDLKHLADRKKNSGSAESTGLYFEAALKFLHGASLLESSGSGNSKRGDIIHSMQVYSSTAKLCEFCAHEYEKSKDLAFASLAYKCMEVAYLRVIYSSHPAASRDRHELQTSLQMLPPGESPSSSASDIDNASNRATAEKASRAKDGDSPQPPANHVIAARSRPIFSRLLNFMQDVNSAMEASRKSQGVFAAAKATLMQADSKEGISTVKRVLDFNFHDVNRLLHLVRVAMEAIKR